METQLTEKKEPGWWIDFHDEEDPRVRSGSPARRPARLDRQGRTDRTESGWGGERSGWIRCGDRADRSGDGSDRSGDGRPLLQPTRFGPL
jgi:hypothetical protein